MNSFFRFPLRVLSSFETPRERLNNLVGYCVIDVGRKSLRGVGDPSDTQNVFKRGRDLLNVNWEGTDPTKDAEKQHSLVVNACGSQDQATVSISTIFFWNCLYGLRETDVGSPLSYREFSVLCAVLSKLGDKDLASCSWQEIQRRALGYATKEEMARKLPNRADKSKPLSRQQIRATLTALERNKFFARYSVGNGDRLSRQPG